MRILVVMASVLWLAACSSVPQVQTPQNLFADLDYGEPPGELQTLDVFALSPAMEDFLAHEVRDHARRRGAARGLYAAMSRELHIDYDATMTRTAAQTFDARAGNCLSLVILTSAFAKRMGVPVRYQLVHGEQTWTRIRGTLLLNGHVNIALEPRNTGISSGFDPGVVIDFLPPADLQRQQTSDIDETQVIAMYLNNRAAEMLIDGRVDSAYWWARAALHRDPTFVEAYNTLGVIHRRHGELWLAERSFEQALTMQPDNPQLLSNLVSLFDAQGRGLEAEAFRQRLAQVEPERPFALLDAGDAALAAGDVRGALTLYRRELARMPYNAEVNYAIAVASARLGRDKEARKYLAQASQLSTNLHDRDIYASKLEKLQALHVN